MRNPLLVSLVVSLAGCAAWDNTPQCLPGTVKTGCICDEGRIGYQVCSSDGRSYIGDPDAVETDTDTDAVLATCTCGLPPADTDTDASDTDPAETDSDPVDTDAPESDVPESDESDSNGTDESDAPESDTDLPAESPTSVR